eukprot:SM002607S09925  [mRNA]  locus=s2607:278:568:- [translate_table: standard]
MERGAGLWSRFVGTRPAPGGPFMAASVVESAREEGDRRRARAKHCTDVGVQAGLSAALWAAAFSTVVT